MKVSLKKIVSILVFHCLFTAQAFELHVASNGSDRNKGTLSSPFLTIEKAKETLRSSGRIGREPCRVLIHEGVYRLKTALRFGVEDGGTQKNPVSYEAVKNEKVILTGAQVLSSTWSLWKDGIYRTNVKDLDAIDQLFINGERQHMARFPNHGAGFVSGAKGSSDHGKKSGTAPFDGCSPMAWNREKAANWKKPEGAFMHTMHRSSWGSQHYVAKGKNEKGEILYEGGWQNNRSSAPNQEYRMIENVFEELDVSGEWYHDTEEGFLYYKPKVGVKLKEMNVEVVLQIKHLIELYGEYKSPVSEMKIVGAGNHLPETHVKNYETLKPIQHIHIAGIRFTGTRRTFMETKEPLLRSDWCVYRGGAIHIRGAEHIVVRNCQFEELGGNAVFIDSYNRNISVLSNLFQNNGASDVNFVGAFAAVRNPKFRYSDIAEPLDKIDTKVGPKSEDYPADCIVEDNLMMRCGRYEKQACGINMSMSSRITVRHNTISHTPRAAINVCDGTWGGHIIEWNDCFETVLETHDHGAFNSWGRDRYWHSCSISGPKSRDKNGKAIISYYIEKYPNIPFWDAYQTTILRNNRMQCHHGWDIDLDDGSTNYEIYNNICLSGGLKTREGYGRKVTNNVILNRGYTCNVPYPKPTQDVFERNILWGGRVYSASDPTLWGGIRDFNFVHHPDAQKTEPALGIQKSAGDDANSLYGNVNFVNPKEGNFKVDDASDALKLGYKNFPMKGFGVTSDALKALAGKPKIAMPEKFALNIMEERRVKKPSGAQFKNLETEAELSATGMFAKTGVLLVALPKQSPLVKYGFEIDDVILELDGVKIANDRLLTKKMKELKSGKHKVKVWRNQEARIVEFTQ